MVKEKILILESDKGMGEAFSNWLKKEDYNVEVANNIDDANHMLSHSIFDIFLVDLDSLEVLESLWGLCQSLKQEDVSDIPICILTYKNDAVRIASAIEAEVDRFIVKPFDTAGFLRSLQSVLKEIEHKKKGQKSLDVVYINYLIQLSGGLNRRDFFLVMPVIFNKLIMDKIKTIIGESIVAMLANRLQEVIGRDYEFMSAIRFYGTNIVIDDVNKFSQDIAVEQISEAFNKYVSSFLRMLQGLTSDILMDAN